MLSIYPYLDCSVRDEPAPVRWSAGPGHRHPDCQAETRVQKVSRGNSSERVDCGYY